MVKHQLHLIPFAPDSSRQAVHELFSTLGYQVDVINNEQWLSKQHDAQSNLSVLFLNQDELPVERLRDHLIKGGRSPLFAIIGNNQLDANSHILELCDDFTTWPCNEQELSCRLERLRLQESYVFSDLDEQALMEEFIGLNLIGKSDRFLFTLNQIKKIARCDAPVLIDGETGTGKEVTARAIHYLGARRDHPFVPVNCGAIPDNLFENELFGHERGAFTDARESQPGLIAQADGGTLFLDEIDAMSSKAQVALLRFLQDQQYRPLGSKSYKQADVRIITATNTDLRSLVEKGDYREDLYFRINLMSLSLPPLRERCGDVHILAEHFLQTCRERYPDDNKYFHPHMFTWFENNNWPGNIRELENTIHRLYLLSDGEAIHPYQNEPAPATERRRNVMDRRKSFLLDMSFSEAKAFTIEEFEKFYLHWLMAKSGGNVTRAARLAGKERRALGKLLKKYQIDKTQ